MKSRVTVTAERDQVLFGIFTRMTPKVLMMNLETFEHSTALASPSISLQDLGPLTFVRASWRTAQQKRPTTRSESWGGRVSLRKPFPSRSLHRYLVNFRIADHSLDAVADRLLVNIQSDVIHMSVEEPPWLFSESTWSLSSAFVHHALLLDLAFKQSARNRFFNPRSGHFRG